DVPAGTEFGGGPNATYPIESFEGATPDLTHVVLSSSVPLTSTPTGNSVEDLYEWSAGKPQSEKLQLVSILPQSEGGTGVSARLGYGENSRKAISNDGS